MRTFLYYQPSVSSYTLMSSILHRTQAHSCKNGLLKDDCTPASILEFKSINYVSLMVVDQKSEKYRAHRKPHKTQLPHDQAAYG